MKQIELVIRTLENSTVVKEEVLSRFDCEDHLTEKEPLHFSGLCIDLIQHQISYEKKELPLTEKEYQELIWEKIKEINQQLPVFKHIKKISITTEPLIKTTTQKVKRQEEIKRILGK